MEELFRDSLIKLRGMWMYRALGLAVAWTLGVLGFVTIALIPDKYEASARIFVNTDSILKPLMTGLTVQPNEEQRITMLSRVVISRPNVEKLVQAVGLDAFAKTRDEHEKLVDRTTRLLEFKGAGRDNLYRLSFRDENSVIAKKAIDLLTEMFIESSKGGKSADTEAAKRFIDEQVAVYDKKLQEAENRLKEFRVKNLGITPGTMTPGDGRDYFSRVSEVERLLNQSRLELREAENAREAYRSRLQSDGTGGGVMSMSPAMIELDARIDSARNNIDSLLQRYTEAHPDVQSAHRVLRDLEEQKRRALASPGSQVLLPSRGGAGTGLSAADSLKVSLAQTEATIASLRIRVAEYSDRYAKLKSNAALLPQLEAEHAQLNRDYEVNKRNYESLVTRRESANISGDMQAVAGVSEIRLVDPPRVSARPVSPNRKLLLPIALLGSIVAGLFAAYVASQVRPSFFDPRTVRELTGLPVLGVVSLVANDESKRLARRGALRFAGSAATLVMGYLVGLVLLEFVASRLA